MNKHIISILFVSILASTCSQIEAQKIIGECKLTNIDFNDPKFKGWQVWLHDTIVTSGWEIKYLIKNDQRKYQDLYIQWSYKDCKGICKFESVLETNGVTIPRYEGENENCIFMLHACGSTCYALLLLSKDQSPTYHDYLDIVNYSIDKGQLLYVTEYNERQDTTLQVSLVDLNNRQEHLVNFNYACPGVFKRAYIDTVIYDYDKTIIKATFIKDKKEIKEQQIVNLK